MVGQHCYRGIRCGCVSCVGGHAVVHGRLILSQGVCDDGYAMVHDRLTLS